MVKQATLSFGDRNEGVKALQRILSLKADGIFGRNTERAVERFQKENDLYVDGVVGPITWRSILAIEASDQPTIQRQPWEKVKVTKYKQGYAALTLRKDTAHLLELASDRIYGSGGILTSSGGRRPLSASVGANRSKTSLHYTGRAFDLYMWSGMIDPTTDPFIVTLDDEDRRLWRVYAVCEDAPLKDVTAWTYDRAQLSVRRRVLDLTALLREFGISRIPARKSFFRSGSRGAAEWWHFQDINGLTHKASTFGDELLKVWPKSSLVDSPVWRYKDYVWNNYGFTQG